jgi:hypothetical protein
MYSFAPSLHDDVGNEAEADVKQLVARAVRNRVVKAARCLNSMFKRHELI